MTENWNIDNEPEGTVTKDKNGNIIRTTEKTTTPPAEKYPLPTGMLGSGTRLQLPRDPSILESILKPENKPQLDINNLMATVPERPLGAGYYTPIHQEPVQIGQTGGMSGVNLGTFGAAGTIFPMGLWDERRRSLLNAYQQRQSQMGQALQPNYWEADKTAAELQGIYNEHYAQEGNALAKEAAATGNIQQLSNPDLNTSFGKKVQAFHDNYKKIAALGIFAVDQANKILTDKSSMQWQKRIANNLKSGKITDINEIAKSSELLYKIGNYDAALQDRADALMKARDILPAKREDVEKAGFNYEEVLRSGNGAGVMKYVSTIKALDEGKFSNISQRLALEYSDMYNEKYKSLYGRDATQEEKIKEAKDDLKELVGRELSIGTTGFNPTNININNAKPDKAYVSAYVNAYNQNKEGITDLLTQAAEKLASGDFQGGRNVFNGMDKFTDDKGRKMLHFVNNSNDNMNSVIKWKAVGENPPIKQGAYVTKNLQQVYDDLVHLRGRQDKDALKVAKLLETNPPTKSINFQVSGINGVFIEPGRDKPVTYAALVDAKDRSILTKEPLNLSGIAPGWAFYLSAKKPKTSTDYMGNYDNDIDLSDINYSVYENLDYSPGQEASQYNMSSGQPSWEDLNAKK